MTPAPSGPSRYILSAVYLLWLAGLALASHLARPLVPPDETLAGRTAILRTFRAGLEAMHRETGAYPDTGGVWMRIPVQNLPTPLPEKPAAWMTTVWFPWKIRSGIDLIYRSDGRDFKLIYHGGIDARAVYAAHPEMVDQSRAAYTRIMSPVTWPVPEGPITDLALRTNPALRKDPDLGIPLFGYCWAFGFWTEGAVFW